MRKTGAGLGMLLLTLLTGGCTVVSVAGSAVSVAGSAVSVAGSAVSAGVAVGSTVVKGTANVVGAVIE